MNRILSALLIIALTGMAHAGKIDAGRLELMTAQANWDAALLNTDHVTGKFTGIVEKAAAAAKKLDEALKPALAGVKGSADLTTAAKEYYLASKTFFEVAEDVSGSDGLRRMRVAAAKRAMDDKNNALEMEMKLAGID